MKKLLLTFAVASAVLTSSAATRILYQQNFETVTSAEEAGWSFGGESMSIASDSEGKFLELSLGQNNGRSGQVTWGQDIFLKDEVSVLEDGTYTVQYDFCIAQGSNNQYNGCFTVFTNHAPIANQGYRNPWSPAGWWDNYLFDMSQVASQPLQFAVNGNTLLDGDTRSIDYSTPANFDAGQWYTVTLNVDVNNRTVEYTVAPFGETSAIDNGEGTLTVPEYDVQNNPISMFAQGLYVFPARYQTICRIDNIRIYFETAEDYANVPTVALSRLGVESDEETENRNLRAYTITFLEDETLHVMGTDGVETQVEYWDAETPGKQLYETTQSGTLKAWTTYGDATSEVVEIDVDCNPCVLPQAVATISAVSEGYGKTYTLTIDNSDVPLRPQIGISYEFIGKSGNTFTKDKEVSGCKVTVEEEGTLKVTTKALGFEDNIAVIENNLEFEVKKAYDFARMGDEEIKAAGFPDYTVLNSATTSGFSNWTARKRLYYELAGSEHEVTDDAGTTTIVRDFVYPFGFVAEDNTTNVINYAVIDNSAKESVNQGDLFEGLTIFPDKGKLSAGFPNVGIMRGIGIFNDQTNNNNNNIIVHNLDNSDFVAVNYINNYGGNSNHPVVASDEEYFKALAGDDVIYSVAASGVLDEATNTYTITHPLYRVDTACTKITVFKQAGAQSGLENVVVAEEENTDEGWYTITGLRLEKPTAPGLYIHKGKKVIVK